MVRVEIPASPPQQSKFVIFDAHMSRLIPARHPAAAGDCIHTLWATLSKKSHQNAILNGEVGDLLHTLRPTTTRVSSPFQCCKFTRRRKGHLSLRCSAQVVQSCIFKPKYTYRGQLKSNTPQECKMQEDRDKDIQDMLKLQHLEM